MYKLFFFTTHDGGCLGSSIDEERSKLRYVVRIAEPVNHRIFERKWRSRAILRACLFECPQKCNICSISQYALLCVGMELLMGAYALKKRALEFVYIFSDFVVG